MNTVFTAYLGIGSNLGDRLASLSEAVDHLQQHENINVDMQGSISSIYKTSPVGVTDTQRDYYNAVLRVETSLTPLELLHACSKIENQMGRVRIKHKGSRVIDIDVLLYENVVMETDSLTLPHPRMHKRLFVLTPLCEIAGDVLHPVINKSIRGLHEELMQRNESGQASQDREHIERLHLSETRP